VGLGCFVGYGSAGWRQLDKDATSIVRVGYPAD
jgi:hypothetical protein